MKRLDELGVSPAPWRVEGGPMAAIVYENKPTMKCGSVCALTGAQRNADAALIAAAPDMYEALRVCETVMCDYCRREAAHTMQGFPCENGCAVMLAAKAALEKAGGAE